MAAASTRDGASTTPATSATSPSTAAQTNTAAGQTDQSHTIYACTLHGLIANPPTSTTATADPNAPTLPNLLALLNSITPRHSSYLGDYSQYGMVSNYTLYHPTSLTHNTTPPSPPPNTDRTLHSRLTALATLLHTHHTEARIFAHYERVYAPASATLAGQQPQLPLRLSRPAIPPLPTTPYLLTSYSRPLPPARHITHVRAIRSLPLHHLTKVHTASSTAGASSDECDTLMDVLAYRFSYEYVREGYVWLLDAGVSVSVWRLCRLQGALHDLASVDAVRGMQWVVEVSAQAAETQLSAVEERVVSVAKLLVPLVKCTKLVPET